MKLLIVDDSALIRSRIARILSDPRLASIQLLGMAKNGKEAVMLFLQHMPELVTMDITMPEMDVFQSRVGQDTGNAASDERGVINDQEFHFCCLNVPC
jgi:chemotaxis response regulator CheB